MDDLEVLEISTVGNELPPFLLGPLAVSLSIYNLLQIFITHLILLKGGEEVGKREAKKAVRISYQ